jgi:hypothetical protein
VGLLLLAKEPRFMAQPPLLPAAPDRDPHLHQTSLIRLFQSLVHAAQSAGHHTHDMPAKCWSFANQQIEFRATYGYQDALRSGQHSSAAPGLVYQRHLAQYCSWRRQLHNSSVGQDAGGAIEQYVHDWSNFTFAEQKLARRQRYLVTCVSEKFQQIHGIGAEGVRPNDRSSAAYAI